MRPGITPETIPGTERGSLLWRKHPFLTPMLQRGERHWDCLVLMRSKWMVFLRSREAGE